MSGDIRWTLLRAALTGTSRCTMTKNLALTAVQSLTLSASAGIHCLSIAKKKTS